MITCHAADTRLTPVPATMPLVNVITPTSNSIAPQSESGRWQNRVRDAVLSTYRSYAQKENQNGFPNQVLPLARHERAGFAPAGINTPFTAHNSHWLCRVFVLFGVRALHPF